jgi:RNA polymerase sigma factor (sigma-70 family)
MMPVALDHPRARSLTHTGPIAASRDDAIHHEAIRREAIRREATDDDATRDFVGVYEHHYPRLVRALEISGATRPEAEDIAQEAFARTLSHWRRVRNGANPPGYAYTVAFRLARKRMPPTVLLGDDLPSPDVAGEAVANVAVASALAAMPPRRRTCAVLCLLGGLSPAEAGQVLGIEASTVRKQLEHARAALAVQLER